MNRIGKLIFILILITAAASAQNARVKSIHWRIAGSIPAADGQQIPLGLAGAIAGKSGNALIIAGGSNFPDSMPWLGGKKKYYDEVYVFLKNKDGVFEHRITSNLPFNLAYAASCITPQGVLSAGGENESGLSKKVFLMQWDESNQRIDLRFLPDLPIALTNASVVCRGKSIYLSGGETINEASIDFLTLDLYHTAKGWSLLPPLPKPVSHAVMVSQFDGKQDCIYLIGGRKKRIDSTSELYATNYQFNFTTNEWSQKNALPYVLSAGTGVPVGSNYILLFGGDEGKTFQRAEELIVAIKKEADEKRRNQLNMEKSKLQSSHPGFSKTVLMYNTVTDGWSRLNPVPFEVPVTTTAFQWGNCVVISGGEIKAGVRSPNILVGEINIAK